MSYIFRDMCMQKSHGNVYGIFYVYYGLGDSEGEFRLALREIKWIVGSQYLILLLVSVLVLC